MDGNSSDLTIQLAKFVKFREERFGGVLFETRSEKVFTLNSTGAAVVREIQAGRDEATINLNVKAQFLDQSETISADIAAFIDELRSRALIVG
jgi:hypothetical protein